MTSRSRTARTALTAVLAIATLLLASACGGGDDKSVGGGSSSGGGSKGKVVLSGQNFTEMQILASLYSQVLDKAGYSVTEKLVDTRPIYIDQLTKGSVQVAPDYLAGIGDYLNTQKNGETAKSLTTNDPAASVTAIKPLTSAAGITLLDPAKATDQNAYAVTKKYASDNNLKTLTDLGALKKPIKLAAAKDCKSRDDCAKGLKETYGIDITDVVGLGFDSPQGKAAAKSGEVQLVQVATTDGALDSDGLVLLDDDKGLQPAQNLIPAVNSTWIAKNAAAETALNKLSAALTTDDLAAMNSKVDNDREKPADVAKSFLSDKGLL